MHPSVDLTVYYGHDGSVTGEIDREFGVPVKWDRPLLEGYRSVFLTSRARPSGRLREAVAKASVIVHLWRGRYDAVFIHSYATFLSLMAYVGAWLTRTPVLLRTESHLLRARPAATEAAKNIVLRSLFRWTSAFLAIGEANRRFYEHYGVDRRRMFFTPYCVDNAFLDSERRKLGGNQGDLRRQAGLEPDVPVVVYSGKLIELKHVQDLLAAASVLRRNGQPCQLLVIGDGPCKPALIERARALDVAATFAGFQNQTQLPRYYCCGDVLVLPSERETWGLVLNEAMVFGMPIVTTTAVGAHVDLVDPGLTGFVYECGDHQTLANRLRAVLENPAVRDRMGEAARQHIQSYSYDECVNGILGALSLVSQHSAAPRHAAIASMGNANE